MLAGEQNRLEKERQFRELEVLYKQLQFLIDRLNSYNTQATLVTGFAFTAFSADALQALPVDESPIRAYAFCAFCALSMSCAISVVVISSYLMSRAERLAMNNSVIFAVAAVRLRMPLVYGMYGTSLAGLFGAACFLVFATCGGASGRSDHNENVCDGVGATVVSIFSIVAAVCFFATWRVGKSFDAYAVESTSDSAFASRSYPEGLSPMDHRSSALSSARNTSGSNLGVGLVPQH